MEVKKVLPLKEFRRVSLKLPSSKSLMQRALICSALAKGSSFIKNPLLSEDPLLLKSALEATGVIFERKEGDFEVKGIEGSPRLNNSKIYLGNNGTGARFFLAYATLGKGEWIDLYGKERLHERPMSPLISALRSLSAKVECLEKEGYFPVRVYEGNLNSGRVSLPGYVSSQFISALLLIGPYLPSGLEIAIEGELFSKSYVDMTLEVMERFGVKAEVKSNFFYAPPGVFKASIYEVPADASSASYFLAIPLILGQGSIVIENFDYYTQQADSVFLEFIKDLGGMVRPLDPMGVEVFFEGRPRAGSFNLRDCPDLFPTMAILGAVAEGRTVLYGAPHLRYKETDRIKAVATELSKIGVRVEELPDGLVVHGEDKFKPARIETYDDHRIAMAFAILALKAGPLEIENPECVAKSFPNFWEHFDKLYAENPSDWL